MAKQLKDFLESFEFNRAALAKQRLQNLRHLGKHKVRGARIANLMRAAGLKEEEIDETDLDQLDEVLASDASSEDYIKDFVHSTDPRFEGKTKKERIKMALGAYYAKSRHKDGEGLAEEVEQIDEKSEQARRNKTLKNVMDASKGAQFNRTSGLNIQPGDTGHQTKQQMNKALGRALRKEDLDEAKDTVTKDASGKVTSWKHEGDWKKTPSVHKDQFGNVIKDKNVARNLARQGMKQAMQEEYGVEIDDEVADQILEAAKQYAGLEKEDKKGLPTAMIKKSDKAVKGDTVEGWDHPHKAVQKESYDEEGNLITMPKTYQEFMEGITVKTATGYRHIGTYGTAKGAKYGNTDYDKETLDTKDDDEGQEQQKRGRGRPAGSKSGARGPRIK